MSDQQVKTTAAPGGPSCCHDSVWVPEVLASLSQQCAIRHSRWAHPECGRKAGGPPAGARPRWAARCARRLRRPGGHCARPGSGPSTGGTTRGARPTPRRSRLQVRGGRCVSGAVCCCLLPFAKLRLHRRRPPGCLTCFGTALQGHRGECMTSTLMVSPRAKRAGALYRAA